jgi:hypothetical protein
MYWYILIQNGFRLTAEELKNVIDMLLRPEFDSAQVDPDLHKRMNKAVEDGHIKCFNMRESNLDGDQDLNFWTREIEDLVLEIMEDPVLKAIRTTSLKWIKTRQANVYMEERQMLEWRFRQVN